MSWFTEIAGKAEDLLNKVDQTAATALQNKSKSSTNIPASNSSKISTIDTSFGSSFLSKSACSSTEKNPTPASVVRSSSENKPLYSSGVITPRKKPESDDEKLLRFLNCNDSLPTPSRKGKEKIAVNKMEVSSKIHSVVSKDVEDAKESENEVSSVTSEPSDLVTTVSHVSENQDVTVEDSNESTTAVPALTKNSNVKNVHNINDELSNQDMLLALKRAEHAEGEMKRMTKKLDHWNSQISGNDKVVRELKEREKDMIAAMDAKDSQLAILKVRLQEADQELHSKRNIIEDLKAENERIVKEHANGAAFQNKTVETLQEHLQQVEADLNKTRESFLQSQTEHMQQMGKMEEEHRHLVESYTSLQRKWTEANDRNKELVSQLKNANGNYDAIQREYNDYKQKAQRILQSKEKLISSLKEGHFEIDSIEKNEASSALLNAEVEGVKQERDLLKDELRRANELLETYRSEVQELEKISQNDLLSSQERCRILKEQLEMEKMQKEESQLSIVQLKEELQFLREDLTRTKTGLQSRIQDREIEIEKLRRQLTAKSLSTISQDELESRLHALTENLIQKQTFLEALSTEKNSLVLQLERLEQQLREAQSCGSQQHSYVGINNNETERKTKAVFLENPFDSALTRRVKKVYGTIDSLSVRMGVFFRRYPFARVFVLIYMLLLHFWVMIVLLTYEPEIHNTSQGISKNQ